MPLQYDERKNVINLRKHGIPLEDGLVAINDPDAIVLFDEKYSDLEKRFVAIGRCGSTLQEELVWAGVLPAGYDFDGHRDLVPMQPGDVPVTYADSAALEKDYGFRPSIGIREGLRKFAEWYKGYYG